MSRPKHRYALCTQWDGAGREGTLDYASYSRNFAIHIADKPTLCASADPGFRGDATLHNPEELFLAAVSSCHMLFYLGLCARAGVPVLSYVDHAHAQLQLHADGGGVLSEIQLRPTVVIAAQASLTLAQALHEQAAGLCFIARSCAVPITHDASISHAHEVIDDAQPES